MALKLLLDGSFPNQGDEERVRQIIIEDVGKNKLGLSTQWRDGDVHFAYPIVVLSTTKC